MSKNRFIFFLVWTIQVMIFLLMISSIMLMLIAIKNGFQGNYNIGFNQFIMGGVSSVTTFVLILIENRLTDKL